MLAIDQVDERLQPLLHFGEDDSLRNAAPDWRDYASELGLTSDDVPALIDLIERWPAYLAEVDELADDANPLPDAWFAPMHAWRALGQLKAESAIAPMLAQVDALDDYGDDWSMEDWPQVFAMIGPTAIDPLESYLGDVDHHELSRVLAYSGLAEIAKRYPDSRDRIVAVFTQALDRQEVEPTLNAHLIAGLTDLRAVESAEIIERAFAAEIVEEFVCGPWITIRKELGVTGLGLASDRPMKPSPWMNEFRGLFNTLERQRRADSAHRDEAKREKAKRRAAAKAKKRNRRGK
jgi:hypothetical protein